MFFQIVYYFLLVGNGDTKISRLSLVTWTRHFFSISTPFYCLFGADGDVLHLGEELSPHDSAVESWQNKNPLNKGVRKNLTPYSLVE